MIKDLSQEIRKEMETGQIRSAFELLIALHCAGIRDNLDQIIIDRSLIAESMKLPIAPEIQAPPVPEFG